MNTAEIKILLIDDVLTARQLVRNQLKEIGFNTIAEAENGEDAVDILNRSLQAKSPIQMILADWNMPKMSGLELINYCRSSEVWRNLPIVLLTSERNMEKVSEAVMAGASQYVLKPSVPAVLEEKLRLAWAKHHP